MTEITRIDKPGMLYIRMQTAIAECHSADDCARIATQASAIAAYFRQIKDDESVRKFLLIKLRAWRRVGEIFLTLNFDGCDTQVSHARRIREAFKMIDLSDSAIWNALQIGKLPSEFFEQEINARDHSIYTILSAYNAVVSKEYWASAEGQAERRRRDEALALSAAKQATEDAEAVQQKQRQRRDLDLLRIAREEADEEVGYTMDRRDRENMREVVFLIKEPVHTVLRQAAFDHHITMQAVLRAGLAMWLAANGYEFDPTALRPPRTSDLPKNPRRRPRRHDDEPRPHV